MAKRAKKPKTEITAMAQWGKDELSLPFCTLVVGLIVCEELERSVDEEVGEVEESVDEPV